jgi:hypothetical protein
MGTDLSHGKARRYNTGIFSYSRYLVDTGLADLVLTVYCCTKIYTGLMAIISLLFSLNCKKSSQIRKKCMCA